MDCQGNVRYSKIRIASLSCRYSPQNISPNTRPPTPSTYQHSRTCQLVKILTSSCSQPHTPTTRTHTTRAGKDSHSIMIIIIIMISIRWIYIYFVDYSSLLFSWPFLIHKESVYLWSCGVVFVKLWCSVCGNCGAVMVCIGLGLSVILTHLIWHIR